MVHQVALARPGHDRPRAGAIRHARDEVDRHHHELVRPEQGQAAAVRAEARRRSPAGRRPGRDREGRRPPPPRRTRRTIPAAARADGTGRRQCGARGTRRHRRHRRDAGGPAARRFGRSRGFRYVRRREEDERAPVLGTRSRRSTSRSAFSIARSASRRNASASSCRDSMSRGGTASRGRGDAHPQRPARRRAVAQRQPGSPRGGGAPPDRSRPRGCARGGAGRRRRRGLPVRRRRDDARAAARAGARTTTAPYPFR